MRRVITALLLAGGVVTLFALAFNIYGQFALDHTLESLKQALEAPPAEIPSELGSGVFRPSLETVLLEEVTHQDRDLKSLILLDHATRSIRESVEDSSYARAGVYLSEVVRERALKRNFLLKIGDSVYYFAKLLLRTVREFADFLIRPFGPRAKPAPLEGAGVLLLGEAGRMEKSWKLEEARRYYEEFLNRYPNRPENGFVKISLAHVLTKTGKLDEAKKILKAVIRQFAGGGEETAATQLLAHIVEIRRQQLRVSALESWIQEDSGRFYTEQGGLELALIFLATYQVERALSILEKLGEAPDPSVRSKALFYRGWIHKWQGDFEKGREILELLSREAGLGPDLETAARAALADLYCGGEEYEKALESYQQIATEPPSSAIKALGELEQSNIYLFGLNRLEEARERIQRLETTDPGTIPLLVRAKGRLEEALKMSLRDQAFVALSETRVEEALRMFEQYLLQFPRDGLAHSGLASIYILQGKLDQALESAERGYGLTRDEYTASVLAYVHEKRGQYDEASRYYAIATGIFPNYVAAHFNLARIYAASGKYEEAERLLERLEERSGSFSTLIRAKVLNNRGCVLWDLGKEKEAVRLFKEALKVKPDLIEAKDNLRLTSGSEPILAQSGV